LIHYWLRFWWLIKTAQGEIALVCFSRRLLIPKATICGFRQVFWLVPALSPPSRPGKGQ
jgi:hypothetical protein